MEEFLEKIHIHHIDAGINALLRSAKPEEFIYPKRFSHNEEFFIKTGKEIIVPQMPVHHDISLKTPGKQYSDAVRNFITTIVGMYPGLFSDLTYIFDPTDIHKLKFLKLYRVEKSQYLYFLAIDLLYKTHYHEILKKGNNDLTPEYKTHNLFLEANFIPVAREVREKDQLSHFEIKQTISETWIGEKGRGYLLKGIWMDDDLTKFFSRLFLPENKRIYPYYPLVCKHKTVCLNVIDLTTERRRKTLPYLHHALKFLVPNMNSIEQALKQDSFTEDLPLFKGLKAKLPEAWKNAWGNIQVKTYLNENNLKEYAIDT